MHHREDVLAMHSISFHMSSVRIVGTIFLIRNTHLNSQKKKIILLYGCENWTLLLKKGHRQFFGIECVGGRDIFEPKEYWKGEQLLYRGIWRFAVVMKHYLDGEIKAGEMKGSRWNSEIVGNTYSIW
jgi:hypothetical protein